MKLVSMTFLVAALGLAVASPAVAIGNESQPRLAAPDDEMKALKKRFEERFPRLRDLRASGVLGETDAGYVEFVKAKQSDAEAVVEDENADRRKLYELIAAKESVSAETVARRNAVRNFEKARKGEYLKKGGEWSQKG